MARRKCIHGKELGCCGYDELAHKPATTTPLNSGKLSTKKLKGDKELGGFDRSVYRVSNLG